ncbi:MAG: hypothetical protein ACP5QK_09105 [Myxococcota bacterium]
MRIALINHLYEENGGYYSNLVLRSKEENLKDIINTLREGRIFDKIILQTNKRERYKNLREIIVEDTSNIGNFGERIEWVFSRFKGCSLFYTGSGSSVFLRPDDIKRYLSHLKRDSIIANNLYSADYFFIYTSKKRLNIRDIKTDNTLPKILIERNGFYGIEIRRDEFSLFDIDGPLDLLALKISEKGGVHLRKFLSITRLSNKNLKRALRNFTERDAEVLFWGRISEFLIQFLRYRTACRTKFVVEGRGLVSQGGKGFYSIFFDAFNRVNKRFLFEKLPYYCDALFLDSRILFAHSQIVVNKEDRYALDMLDYKRIFDTNIKNLCKMALSSEIPVLFCNHSFLNSGIPLLIDYEWRRKGYRTSKFGNGIIKEIFP